MFDPSKKESASRLSSQIKELAAGTFHEGVKKDQTLAGKNVEGFLEMIASGNVLFRNRTEDHPALSISLNYHDGNVPCTLGLSFDRIYLAPPNIEAKVEDGILQISFDLRIDLKKLLPPRSLPDFLKAVSSGHTGKIEFNYLASKSTDIFGNSCSMFTLEPETYTMELFASKKEFPKG
jgi:hypothetical protein